MENNNSTTAVSGNATASADNENTKTPKAMTAASILADEGKEFSDLEPQEIIELLSHGPDDVKQQVRKFVSMSLSMTRQSPETLLASKLSGEHISTFLEASKEQMHLSFSDRKDARNKRIILLVIGGVFLLAFIWLLKEKPELLEKLMYGFIGLIAGGLGGYGFGKTRKDDD